MMKQNILLRKSEIDTIVEIEREVSRVSDCGCLTVGNGCFSLSG